MKSKLKILSVGGFSGYGESNTCLHRTWALEEFGLVDRIDTSKSPYSLYKRIINKLFNLGINVCLPGREINKKIIRLVKENDYELLWIDKGSIINASTLKKIKSIKPGIKIVGYSPDDMSQRHNQSFNFLGSLKYYDYYFTTKSYIIEKLKMLGAKHIVFVNNAYEEKFHYPRAITTTDFKMLGGDVGFIGSWEMERAESILYLAENGINVRVWGGGKWLDYKGKYRNLVIEDKGLFTEDYCKSIASFKISLCFLRKMNFDMQTTRSVEIPACGGFLMAERTNEHQNLFEEGVEAEFFGSKEELLEKCRFYLENEIRIKEIMAKGLERCIKSGYSNTKVIEGILSKIDL